MANGKVLADIALKLSANTAELSKGLASANASLKTVGDTAKSAGKALSDSMGKASNESVKSFKEMRREMMALRSTSLVGKSKEEIYAINKAIGSLMDEMGDLRAMQRGLGTEFGNLAVQGLQAFGAVIEAGMGVAMMFGVSDENAKKYQATMTAMIGVMQASAVIQDAMETKLFASIAARMKDAAATLAQGAATKVTTAIQWLYEASLAATVATIAIAVVAVAALAAGLYLLYGYLTKNTDAEKAAYEAMKANNAERMKSKALIEEVANETSKAYIPQKIAIDQLVETTKDHTLSLRERQKALRELIALDPKHLSGLTLANIETSKGISILNNYGAALQAKAKAQASEAQLIKLYMEQEQNGYLRTNLLLGIQAEALMLNRRLKEGSYGFNEAEDARKKLAAEVQQWQNLDKTISNNDKRIQALTASLGNLNRAAGNVTFTTGGDGGSPKAAEKDNSVAEFDKREKERIRIWNDGEAEMYAEAEALRKQGAESDDAAAKEANDRFSKGIKDRLAIANDYYTSYDEAQRNFNDRNKTDYELDLEMYKAMLDEKLITAEQYAAYELEIEKRKRNANLLIAAQSMGQIASLFKENTVAYKALATAEATINTYVAASAALKLGPVVGPIAMAGVIAAGLANVAKIAGVKLAQGGIAYGPTMATVGEYPNARSNPEVIAPLNQLKNLIGASNPNPMGGQVRFVIEQDQLVGILSQANAKQIYF